MRNFFGLKIGGAANRAGTTYVGEARYHDRACRLIPFEVSLNVNYAIELGHEYIRFIRDGAHIIDTSLTVTGITQAAEGVVTVSSGTFANGDEVTFSGIVGMTELNGRNFIVSDFSGATFKLKDKAGNYIATTGFGAYASGGTVGRLLTIMTDYQEADIPYIDHHQSVNVMALTHVSYAPRELRRTSETVWTFSIPSFVPSIGRPTNLSSPASGTFNQYKVTAVKNETYEESLPSNILNAGSAAPSPSAIITVNFTEVSGAYKYKIYRSVNEVYGLVGFSGSGSFDDVGVTPDTLQTPPQARNPFNATNKYPRTGAYIQQRQAFANTNNEPETIWMSRTGYFRNFTLSEPVIDSDTITAPMVGLRISPILWMRVLGRNPVFWTDTGEWSAEGGIGGVLTPTEINLRQHDENGASDKLAPLVVGGTALYVQARGSIVRTLVFDNAVEGYRGVDLTIFNGHLFRNKGLTSWCFQKIPHSVVWAARSDGTVLSLTYVREQEISGWARHDFENGFVESLCAIPEGFEDVVYMIVKRTIDGETRRYIERMGSRTIDEDAVEESIFTDSTLTYDGRNTDATHTMTFSGGTDWDAGEEITLTSSQSIFTAADEGSAKIHVRGTDSTGAAIVIRFTIQSVTSATVATGLVDREIPAAMRNTGLTDWDHAKRRVGGLWHLEGETVSVFADGAVVSSPNNPGYQTQHTVADGEITLPEAYGLIHVGLPIVADIKTLDLENVSGETWIDKPKLVNKVTLQVEASRGLWIGPDEPDDDTDLVKNLTEWKSRQVAEGYLDPVSIKTGAIEVDIKSDWKSNGRVFLRQIDPVALTVLAVAPGGLLPYQVQA